MQWSEMLSALIGLQGRRVMAQVLLPDNGPGHKPTLTAFGRLGGGPSDFGDAVILALESSHGGSNGVLVLESKHFHDGQIHDNGSVTIVYGPTQIVLTAASPDETDETDDADEVDD